MSGGIYDYAYGKVEEFADNLRLTTPLRKAFKSHLKKIERAMHDIEWVDSGDCAEGDEDKAIKECLGNETDILVLKEILAEARFVRMHLSNAISNAESLVK